MNRSAVPGTAVPTLAQVRIGTSVSIVLKADQRTGREVQGQVKDLLTRGNHPRGIKVRLQDGRIGRVQRMVDAGASLTPASIDENNPLTSSYDNSSTTSQSYTARMNHSRHQDVRNDEYLSQPQSREVDLMSYIKTGTKKKGRKQTTGSPSAVAEIHEITCPVCGRFKGDETAVNLHVEKHFDEN